MTCREMSAPRNSAAIAPIHTVEYTPKTIRAMPVSTDVMVRIRVRCENSIERTRLSGRKLPMPKSTMTAKYAGLAKLRLKSLSASRCTTAASAPPRAEDAKPTTPAKEYVSRTEDITASHVAASRTACPMTPRCGVMAAIRSEVSAFGPPKGCLAESLLSLLI